MSRRKREFLLSLDAWNDLAVILHHSAITWGSEQRATYESLLKTTLASLADSPDIGRLRTELAEVLRCHPVGSHIIYYWTTPDAIEIAHILHERQDPVPKTWDSEID